MSKSITEQGFAAAAKELGVEVATIKAVASVESAGSGFDPDGRVKILFERHKFHTFTRGQFDKSHPAISSSSAGGYGAAGAHQWKRFNEAFELDPDAAMRATSWGKFQIMGFNCEAAGYSSVGEFVEAMKVDEDTQLKAFVKVIKSWGLAGELRQHDWAGFARQYNGGAYKKNKYDTKLAAAYERFKRERAVIPTTTAAPDAPAPDVPDKGITTGVAEPDAAGTMPPAPAAEVKASQPSLFTKLGSLSLPASVMTVLAAIGKFVQGFPPWAWVAIIGAAMVIGYLIWRDAQMRAHQRTLKVMDAAADQTKNNLRLI